MLAMEMEESKLESDYESDYEDFESYESVTVNQNPKRLRTSEAHEYFDDMTHREIDGFIITEKSCQFCTEIIRCDSNEAITDIILNGHLEICTERYGGNLREKSFCDETPGLDENPPVKKFDHVRIRRLIVKFYIRAEIPLNREEIPFIKFPEGFTHPDFRPPTGTEVRNEIEQLYKEEIEVLMEYFKSYRGKVALSYKFWKSSKTNEYVAVTAHYIDSDWNLQKRLLGFSLLEEHEELEEVKKLEEPKAVRIIGKGIMLQVKKWGLANKVISITSDNGDSADVITGYLRKIMPAMGGEDTFFHVRCCAHVLNLIAQNGWQEIDSFEKRIFHVLNDIDKDKSRHEEFLEVFKALGVEYKKIPFYPYMNRWDCTYSLLDAVISYRVVFDRYIVGKPEFAPFSDDDWFLATMIKDFFKVIHDAATYLTRNYNATSCQVLCHILNISLVIEKYPTNPVFSRLCVEAKRKLRSIWEEIPMLCGLCCIMDPRLKFRGLEVFIECIFKSGVYDVDSGVSNDRLTEIKSAFEKLFEKYQAQICSDNVDRSKEVCPSSSHTQNKAWEILLQHYKQSPCDRKSELQYYLDLPYVDGCNEGNAFDILGWWKAHEIIFPVLATMARDLLTVPMSAVFSFLAFETLTGPFLVDDRRGITRLSPAMVNYSRCLKDWSDAENKLQDVPSYDLPIVEDEEEDEELDVEKPYIEHTSVSNAPSQWEPPPDGCFKINVDGVCSDNLIAYAAVIRNSRGEFIGCEVVYGGFGEAVEAEAQAIFLGVQLISKFNLPAAIIEGDAKVLIDAINGHSRSAPWKVRKVIEICKSTLSTTVSFSYISRDINSVAHVLAKSSNITKVSHVWVGEPPPCCILKPLTIDGSGLH